MKKNLLTIVLLFSIWNNLYPQIENEFLELSLEDVINLATDSSLSAFIAENRYYAGYWSYRNFRAQRLPFLNLNTNPLNFNRSVTRQYNFQDSSYYYVEQQILSSSGNISINQTLTSTGGRIYIDSDLGYLNNLNRDAEGQFSSTPVRIGYNQQLFGFNPYKWETRIEPLKFEKAKKTLVENMEEIALRAVNYFFHVARAEINLEIAATNLANADTLYSVGVSRAEIASISREDLLSLKLDLVNARNAMDNAQTSLKRARMNLYSLLRLNTSIEFELILPEHLPELELKATRCLELARENNPDYIDFKQQSLQAAREVEMARKNSQFSADLNASFGLNQQGNDLQSAYKNPVDQEIVRIGLSIPLIDWGLSKGQYQLAKRNREVVELSLQQAEIDLEQSLILTVEEFNLQDRLVQSAAEAEEIAQMAYEITRERFLTGNADIVRLSMSQSESIAAQRNYINALENYWRYFYTIRRMTLYDFVNEIKLSGTLGEL